MSLQPPEWLNEEATEIFKKTVELMGKGAMDLDESAIADFSMAQADVIRLEAVVAFEGDTVEGKAGTPYINPTLTILMTRRRDLAGLRNDLKLTPRSRNSPIKPASKGALAAAMSP